MPTFVELPIPDNKEVCAEPVMETRFTEKATPVLQIKSDSGLCVEVFSDISPTQFRQVIEAMNHVE